MLISFWLFWYCWHNWKSLFLKFEILILYILLLPRIRYDISKSIISCISFFDWIVIYTHIHKNPWLQQTVPIYNVKSIFCVIWSFTVQQFHRIDDIGMWKVKSIFLSINPSFSNKKDGVVFWFALHGEAISSHVGITA